MTDIDRRAFLSGVLGGAAARGVQSRTGSRRATDTQPAAAALANPTFRPLPIAEIRPQGWLAHQPRIQADGLSGHLDEFWPDITDSRGQQIPGWKIVRGWAGELSTADAGLADPANGTSTQPNRRPDTDTVRLHQHSYHRVPARAKPRITTEWTKADQHADRFGERDISDLA
jgi:hypothetical protein